MLKKVRGYMQPLHGGQGGGSRERYPGPTESEKLFGFLGPIRPTSCFAEILGGLSAPLKPFIDFFNCANGLITLSFYSVEV